VRRNCGNRGCWETLASNRAAVRFYEEISGNEQQVNFSELLRLANDQDEAAMAAMDRVAENLGRGMRMIAAALAPTEIIVVGEITSAWHTIGPKVELSLRESSPPAASGCARPMTAPPHDCAAR
jgi:predicted NBD/HSP70 family sugar kinase